MFLCQLLFSDFALVSLSFFNLFYGPHCQAEIKLTTVAIKNYRVNRSYLHVNRSLATWQTYGAVEISHAAPWCMIGSQSVTSSMTSSTSAASLNVTSLPDRATGPAPLKRSRRAGRRRVDVVNEAEINHKHYRARSDSCRVQGTYWLTAFSCLSRLHTHRDMTDDGQSRLRVSGRALVSILSSYTPASSPSLSLLRHIHSLLLCPAALSAHSDVSE